jgi:LysM repeat protein
MSGKPAYKRIESYRRRQRYGPFIVGAIAIILVVVGLVLIFLWWRGSSAGVALFATDTPTPTVTNTPVPPTATATVTLTPTITLTPTEAPTNTASAPFLYPVEEGDTLTSIAVKFGMDELEGPLILMVFNNLSDPNNLPSAEPLIIPDPNTDLPTPTPLPEYVPRGTLIQYLVWPGDTLAAIASEFLSTEEDIIAANDDLDDPNQISYGQWLYVPYGMVTPTRTASPTNTLEAPTETPTP